jgi:hypothetical protein
MHGFQQATVFTAKLGFAMLAVIAITATFVMAEFAVTGGKMMPMYAQSSGINVHYVMAE